jgi:hypothetical protein
MAMKYIATCLMLAGLFGAVGCTPVEKVPEQSQAKRVNHTKPVEEDDFPATVSKLLPADQLDARNAKAQSKLLNDQIEREKSQLNKTETAQRD